MLNIRIRTSIAALLATAIALGCSDSSGSDGDELSDAELDVFASQLTSFTVTAINEGGSSGSASLVGALDGMNAALATALDPIPINFQYAHTQSCPVFGRTGANGSITGSIDSNTGDGVLWLQIVFTYTDCTFSTGQRDVEVNGNPSLTLTGNFTFVGGQQGTQQTLTLSGALLIDGVFCAISLTMNLGTGTGSTTVSGTVCGRSVN